MWYAWTITEDHLCEDPSSSEVGTVGPRTASLTHKEIKTHSARQHFQLHDDDGERYFSGYLVGDEPEGFEPLDDFGRAFGCTTIKYRQKDGTYKDL